jgi:cytochrome c biogenesis factor
MIPEIGHYALILALCVAVAQGTKTMHSVRELPCP